MRGKVAMNEHVFITHFVWFQSLAHRALHPNRPLPPVNKQWLASISPMDERLHLARPVFDEMRHTFHLKKKEIRKDKRTGQDVYQAG